MNSIILFIVLSVVLIILGVAFSIAGIAVLKNINKKVNNCTSKTNAKITDLTMHTNTDTDGDYSTSWHPIIEFNVGEYKIKQEYPYGRSKSKYYIGQEIEVMYNPEDYNEYYIPGDTSPKTIGSVFAIIGIPVLIIGIFFGVITLFI